MTPFVLILIILVLIVGVRHITALATAHPTSPWYHTSPELESVVTCPITYQPHFQRERELFGYQPRFMPAMSTHHPNGDMVMRVGVPLHTPLGAQHMVYPASFWSTSNIIQRIVASSPQKNQYTTSHVDAIRQHYELDEGDILAIRAGERVADSVQFTNDAKAVTICHIRFTHNDVTSIHNILLFSRTDMKSWEVVYEFPTANTRLEPFRYHADNTQLPNTVAVEDGVPVLYTARENPQTHAVTMTRILLDTPLEDTVFQNTMAGDGAHCITVGGVSYLALISTNEIKDVTGTPQYLVSYDHSTQETKTVLMGVTGHQVDVHNTPVIDVDSRGYLHVIGGAHWHSFSHWQSTEPHDISEFTHQWIGGNGDNLWSRDGLTYPGFVIDRHDTLHLVARGRDRAHQDNDPEDPSNQTDYFDHITYALLYLQTQSLYDQGSTEWARRQDLVRPDWENYCMWYHKVSLGRDGRKVFVTYYYFVFNLYTDPAYVQAYEDRWGATELWGVGGADGGLTDSQGKFINDSSRAHDPAIIVTDDGGESWHLMTSRDIHT